ncbi:GTP-binding protein Di-Ras1 [Cichlidogyrus casuarinus]|uniref:GTP-binding protein Di-Ras1 n=1 Tax=Cichlidogyrus casuarinus TaxID=1844966 RepID=A0ABD2QCC5_9PLAT
MADKQTDYRVTVFGAGGVGKSSLVQRFVTGEFRGSYIPTIEDTYRQEVVNCNKQVCTLEITDTTGCHQFPAMQRLSINRGHAFILVFSVTNKTSLEELIPVYTELVSIKSSELALVPVMLVGNKMDSDSMREVSTAQGQSIAKRWKCSYMETSAKENKNVKELFHELLQMETRRNMTLVGEHKKESRIDRLLLLIKRPKHKETTAPKDATQKNGDVSKPKESNEKTKKKMDDSAKEEKIDSAKKCKVM